MTACAAGGRQPRPSLGQEKGGNGRTLSVSEPRRQWLIKWKTHTLPENSDEDLGDKYPQRQVAKEDNKEETGGRDRDRND